ncbi:ribonuclease H-like domain-containing protein [Candidatus Parcubacteria bacterium]|nr:ribonuclease H-like domain-containing protein [Patescibacteria group bacterium]MCG2693843.1 ribonuclease H-like domain-containing protein [Candidatus Parcubacteria bacterium]
MNEIVLDIETQNTFQETGRRDCKLLKLSLLVTYHYNTSEYKVYFEKDLPRLWNELLSAERIIGYNLNGFDYPVLNNYAPYDLLKLPTLDMMDEVQKSLGFRIKLDSIAQGSLGAGKSGNGLDAVRFWKEQKLEELEKYCRQDVKVTKEIYEYGKQNGILRFDDYLTGEKREIKVDFNPQDKKSSAGNLTLGL